MTQRLLFLALFTVTTLAYAGQPPRFNYQGKLSDSSGSPLQGAHDLFFTLWQGGDEISGGVKVFEEGATVNADDGVVSHAVGSGEDQVPGPLTTSMFQFSGDIYLQVAVGTALNVITPRQRLESVPFAITSGDGDARQPLIFTGSFPIIIDTPGSYYLTGNITGEFGQDGILVSADDVTIDLNGYTLSGVSGSGDGIQLANAPSQKHRMTVINGTIREWDVNGIFALGADGCQFRNLKLEGNSACGLRGGASALVESCTATSNNTLGNNAGIEVDEHSVVRNCVSSFNVPLVDGTATGFDIGLNSTITGCAAADNDALGGNQGRGILASNSCIISYNTCNNNNSTVLAIGIASGAACTIIGNNCSSNNGITDGSGAGIVTNQRSLVTDNVCRSNNGAGTGIGQGILVNDYARVERNHCTSHGGGSAGYGIRMLTNASGAMLIKNTTATNTTAGFRFDGGTNYCAENVSDEATQISNVGTTVLGTGDRSNVTF